jgi:hypothetical protein
MRNTSNVPAVATVLVGGGVLSRLPGPIRQAMAPQVTTSSNAKIEMMRARMTAPHAECGFELTSAQHELNIGTRLAIAHK